MLLKFIGLVTSGPEALALIALGLVIIIIGVILVALWSVNDDPLEVTLPKSNPLKAKVVADGYLWDDELDMPAHRAVAIRLLHRAFQPNEEVHHIDHDRKNNKPENLMILPALLHFAVHCCSFHPRYRYHLEEPDDLIRFLKDLGVSYIYLGDIN